jgi:hypothetical protein
VRGFGANLRGRIPFDFIEFAAEDRSLTISAETGVIIRAKGILDIQPVSASERVCRFSDLS